MKEFWTVLNFKFCQKWVWPYHAPQIYQTANIAEKILKFFIDHKLLDGERVLLKYPTLIFSKNGCGPATPLKDHLRVYDKTALFCRRRFEPNPGPTPIVVENQKKKIWTT